MADNSEFDDIPGTTVFTAAGRTKVSISTSSA